MVRGLRSRFRHGLIAKEISGLETRGPANGINPITAFAAPFLAGMAWDKQASNLGSWLGQLGRR